MVANEAGSMVTYTAVGSIYVARTMRGLIDAGKTVIFGGEGNGGLIFPTHQFCRDGGMTAAIMVAILASRRQNLSSLVQQLPKRHMIKDKIATPHGLKIIEYLTKKYSNELLDHTDGLKIKRRNCWTLIRVSGYRTTGPDHY